MGALHDSGIMLNPNCSCIPMNFENEMDMTDKLTKQNIEFKDTKSLS